MAKRYSIPFYEVSSMKNHNVDNSLFAVVTPLYDQFLKYPEKKRNQSINLEDTRQQVRNTQDPCC